MTVYMHNVLDVRPCPPGWRIRVVTSDEGGEIDLETVPVLRAVGSA